MSATARRLAPPTFDTLRFCPHHGGVVRLADCPILTTLTVSGEALSEAELFGADGEAGDKASAEIRRRPGGPRTRWTVDERVESFVDGRSRVVLAAPPPRVEPPKRRFPLNLGASAPTLPTAAELAQARGGMRARPARGCPVCVHPLPAAIDHSDPFSIAFVGHKHATKTTTVAALVHIIGQHGAGVIGVEQFAGTEASLRALSAILHSYRVGERTRRSDAAEFHPPYEFNTRIGPRRDPAVVLLHDVAGEDLMNPELRLDRAAPVLWADAVVFLYDPEDSQRQKVLSGSANVEVDQGVLLHGIFDDLQMRGAVDAEGRMVRLPPLVVAVSKADLLPFPVSVQDDSGDAVKTALRSLGDGEVVAAAERWEGNVHWRFIAPQPPGGEPQGVAELFRLLISLLDT